MNWREQTKNNKKWHRKKGMQPQSDILHGNSSMYFFLYLNISFLVSLIALQQKTRKTHQGMSIKKGKSCDISKFAQN